MLFRGREHKDTKLMSMSSLQVHLAEGKELQCVVNGKGVLHKMSE